MMGKPYVYKLILKDGREYIGVRYTKKQKGFLFDNEYLGSSKYIKPNDVLYKVLLKEFNTKEEALAYENNLLLEFDCVKNKEFANLGRAGVEFYNKGSREAAIKRNKANTGKKRTDEFKARMAEISRGKTLSDETKLKLSIANKGQKRTKEFSEKLSKIKTGVKLSEETKNKLRLHNMDKTIYSFFNSGLNIIEVCTVHDLCYKYNLAWQNIRRIARKITKVSGGWSLIDD